jgi:hypothetical protein
MAVFVSKLSEVMEVDRHGKPGPRSALLSNPRKVSLVSRPISDGTDPLNEFPDNEK